jgi:hypothetical protein
MEAHLRAEPASDVEEADVASRDFEEFYGTNHRRLFTALCLVTGDRGAAQRPGLSRSARNGTVLFYGALVLAIGTSLVIRSRRRRGL